MKKIPKAMYRTVAEIEEIMRDRENVAMRLPPASEEHKSLMKEIARLRAYAEVKRWLGSPSQRAVH